MTRKVSRNKLMIIVIALVVVFGLLGYLIGSKKAIQSPTETPKIESEEQVQKGSEWVAEGLRNISETLSDIEETLS